MSATPRKAWSPYMVGAGIGLLGVLTVLTTGKYLGASTTFARAAAGVEEQVAPDHYKALPYFYDAAAQKGTSNSFKIDWQLMLLAGLAVGALLASIATGEFRLRFTPNMWRARFGRNVLLRWLVAFLGGVLVLFGARMAGGCTSGHGISGMMQLAVSGFVAAACFFIGGILTAKLMYRARKAQGPQGGAQ